MKKVVRLNESELKRLIETVIKETTDNLNSNINSVSNFEIGDKVSIHPQEASAVGYNGSFGTVSMIRKNPRNGKNMYYVDLYNSANGAWFYEEELVN